MELNLIDKVTQRLVYAFYIKDNINSFDNDKSYKIHFACLRKIFSYTLRLNIEGSCSTKPIFFLNSYKL